MITRHKITERSRFRGIVSVLAVFGLSFGLSLVTSAQIMVVPGQFDVDPSGSAVYSVPISVPPGTAGMVPALTIDYTSGGGNGLLGVGWSLGGLPSIARCPKTTAQDGSIGSITYTNSDRFCMGGERLIVTSGTYGADGSEYRTEIEGFSKVTAHGVTGNGPTWFEVQSKSGQTLELGNTSDSRVLATGTSTVRSWGVNKVEDTVGNYLTVTYTPDATNGMTYPDRIDYTGNDGASLTPYNSVQFAYETRPDVAPLYEAGSLQKLEKRLTNIKTYQGVNLVSDYQLAYGLSGSTSRSRITSIKMCDNSAVCLPSTTASYHEAGFSSLTASQAWSSDFGSSQNLNGRILADVNGDGLTDIFAFDGTNSYAALGTGTGFGAKQTWGATPDGAVAQTVCTEITGCFTIGPYYHYAATLFDLNADGKSDITSFSNGGVSVSLSTGTSFATQSLWSTEFGGAAGWGATDYLRTLADVNGDGLVDLVGITPTAVKVALNTGSSFAASTTWTTEFTPVLGWTNDFSTFPRFFTDINGDGMADLIGYKDNGTYVALSTGSSFTGYSSWSTEFGSSAGWSATDRLRTFADVNGDGLRDIVGFGATTIDVALSTGSSFAPSVAWITNYTPNSGGWTSFDTYPRFVQDINGDGMEDIIGIGSSGVYYSLSDGTKFGPASTQWIADYAPSAGGWTDMATYPRFISDVSGDGVVDILGFGSSGTHVSTISTRSANDLLSKITTGLGSETDITYKVLTDSSVYTKDNNATYPILDLQIPAYVVSKIDAGDGIGGSYSSSYSYTGAKFEINGRGFLGFRQHTVKDLQTNIEQITTFRQDYPFIGAVLEQKNKLGSLELNITTNSHATDNLGGTRRLPYLTQTVQQSTDLDGTVLPAVTTTYTYDAYANPTQIVVSTPDGATKTTDNTYTNDTINWFLGRLTNSVVTNVISESGSGGTSGNPGNNAPIALIDNITANEDVPHTFDPRVNDSDPDSDPLTIDQVSTPTNGSASIQSAGTEILYTPNTGFIGHDSFSYVISDGNGGEATGTVLITVEQNLAPIAVNDSVSFTGATHTFDPRANDVDSEGDTLTIISKTNGAQGTVSIVSGGTQLTYTSNNDYAGADSFTYTIDDGHGNTSQATVNVTVTKIVQTTGGVVNAPWTYSVVFVDFEFGSFYEHIIYDAQLNQVYFAIDIAPCPKPSPAAMAYVTLGSGYVYSGGGCQIVKNPTGTSNQSPIAANDSISFTGASHTFNPRVNDSDGNGDPLTITGVTSPASGTAAIQSGGTQILYTPNAGFVGNDSFYYVISDGNGGEDSGLVSVTVVANQIPVAVDDSISFTGASHTFDPRTNDTDGDSDPLTITAVSTPTSGTAAIQSSGTQILYTPNGGFTGNDAFTYTISDGNGGSDTATVSVTVVPNQVPDAVDDSISVSGGSHTFDPRTNDTDGDSDPLTITAVSTPTSGTAVIQSSGTEILYTPNGGFSGNDSFTYTISDGNGGSDTATVSATVTANQVPDAVDDSISFMGASHTFDPRVNDTDGDSDPLTITAVSTPTSGTASIQSSGTQILYTPNGGFTGNDSFTYTISDGNGGSDTATVSVTVLANQPPNAVNDSKFLVGSVLTFDPRTNDSDPESDPLTITAKTNGSYGTVAIVNGGTQLRYTANAGFGGSDSFTYTISDGQGHTDTATVTMTVYGIVQTTGGSVLSPWTYHATYINFIYGGFWIYEIRLGGTTIVTSYAPLCPNSGTATLSGGYTYYGGGCQIVRTY